MVSIESLGVDTIQVSHAASEIRFGRTNQQVIVISHLTVSVDAPVESLRYLAKDRQPFATIVVT